MPALIFCDRAPVMVHETVQEAEQRITATLMDSDEPFIYFDRYHPNRRNPHDQVALRASKITAILPHNEKPAPDQRRASS